LEEVINTFGSEGINAVVDAAGKRFHFFSDILTLSPIP
jgi:hypothetical protein